MTPIYRIHLEKEEDDVLPSVLNQINYVQLSNEVLWGQLRKKEHTQEGNHYQDAPIILPIVPIMFLVPFIHHLHVIVVVVVVPVIMAAVTHQQHVLVYHGQVRWAPATIATIVVVNLQI